jgi:hypothetical protein
MESQFDAKQNKKGASPYSAPKTQEQRVARLQNRPGLGADRERTETAPPIIQQVLKAPAAPLEPEIQETMGARFQHDFSRVRVHTDGRAATSARAVSARAYTVGEQIVFDRGHYAPQTEAGRQLLAHELAHVAQQSQGAPPTRLTIEPPDSPAEQQARTAARSPGAAVGSAAVAVQRENGGGVSVRSPVVEETVTQASDIAGGLSGRQLGRSERELARPIFGTSLDYDRVRLITSDTLQYRTVGNNIYVPDGFTIRNAAMAQTLIHELTHVWQYQHSGTSYISVSLGEQIVAAIGRGSRNFAYAYTIESNQTFFDFNPEQQGSIVENYFAMLRDQREIPTHQAAGVARTYHSNHLGSDGYRRRLSAADRLAEISRELPAHERLIRQMQASMPRREVDVLQLRATDLMQTPGQDILSSMPQERQLMPVRPLLEVRFPGL